MFLNYLKVALRALRRHAGYAALNIAGLALGLAACFLIVLYVQHERSYDGYHPHADRVYRVIIEAVENGVEQRYAVTASGYAPRLLDAFPEVERAVRTDTRGGFLQVGTETHSIDNLVVADAAVFDVFDLSLRRGDPATVLDDPAALVVSERAARALFGDADPVGQVVHYGPDLELRVTGVMADPRSNTHLPIDYLVAFPAIEVLMGPGAMDDFVNGNYYTYLRLAPGTDPRALEAKLVDFARDVRGEEFAEVARLRLQPLPDIHFTQGISFDVPTITNPRYVSVFAAIAIFILLIACVNFTNLATARALRRAREVGVRKLLGAYRGQLVGQFLGESFLQSVVAILLALAIVPLALPLFGRLVGSAAGVSAISPELVLLLVGIGLAAGLAAGAYPAFYLSAFRPALVLKGHTAAGTGAARLRRALIVLQFGISILLIIGTLTVVAQLRHMQDRDLGFDQEQVVTAFMPVEILQRYEGFREALLDQPGVLGATRTTGVPGRIVTKRTYDVADGQALTNWDLHTLILDPDYLETLGLELVAGRNFSLDTPTDRDEAYLINETAARTLGWTDPIGRELKAWDQEAMGRVVGVVKDFHFKSLHQEIEPLVLTMQHPDWAGQLAVRVAGDDLPGTLAAMERTWTQFAPAYAFQYRYLDEDFARLYQSEQRLGQLLGFFAGIAVLVACLGLFGLAALTAAQRTKEIGIRKVLGASVAGLVMLLTRDFVQLVVVGFMLAAPVAYLLLARWLEAFPYRVDQGAGVYALAFGLAALVAILTVGVQALRAARTDPARSLRYE